MSNEFHHFPKKPWIARLVLFAVCFAFWLALAWPVSPLDGGPLMGDILAGVVVSAFVALVMREFVRVNFIRFLNPVSWFWGLAYILVFSCCTRRCPFVPVSFAYERYWKPRPHGPRWPTRSR